MPGSRSKKLKAKGKAGIQRRAIAGGIPAIAFHCGGSISILGLARAGRTMVKCNG
jgi:hypothetical protein